jgi:phosphoheptose isomerase
MLQPTKHSQADLLAQVDLLFEDSIALKRKVQQTQAPIIIQMAEVIAEALRLGGKILLWEWWLGG